MSTMQVLFNQCVNKARDAVKASLGFQPLHDVFVDDIYPRMVAIMPKAVFENEHYRDILQTQLIIAFGMNDLYCENFIFKKQESYDVDWCGSRHKILCMNYILEFMVGVRLTNSYANYKCPKLPSWSILEVSYDEIKPESQTYIGYHTYEYRAVLDTEDKDQCLKDMKVAILENIKV